MRGAVEGDFQADLLSTSFLFGGWSWKKSRFYIWRLFYDSAVNRYVASGPITSHQFSAKPAHFVELAHVGDDRGEFMRRSRLLLSDKIDRAEAAGGDIDLSYEPLAALADMLIDPKYADRKRDLKGLIGGGPQVMKVYPFLRTLTYAVEWEHKRKFVYVLRGRVIADYELFTVPAINPFTGVVRKPVRSRDSDVSALNEYTRLELLPNEGEDALSQDKERYVI